MSRTLTPGDGPAEQEKTAMEVLEEVMKHLPLSLVVEIVESRYRDRRNRFFLQVLGGVLTLILTGSTILYQVYRTIEDAEQAEREQQFQLQQQRERSRVRAEYTEQLERTRTRLQFARTLQSFDAGNIDGSLVIEQPVRVQLNPGERKQFAISIAGAGRYGIIASDPQRTETDNTVASVPAFTPVMYLYQLGDGIVNPLDASTTRSMFFSYDEGTYYLEVEELLSDAGEFTLTVTGRPVNEDCPAGC